MHKDIVPISCIYTLDNSVYSCYNGYSGRGVAIHDAPGDQKRGERVPIRYKLDIMEALKSKGYSSYRIRQEKIFGQKTLQDFRNGTVVLSADCLEKLCSLLDCQVGDILEYVPE